MSRDRPRLLRQLQALLPLPSSSAARPLRPANTVVSSPLLPFYQATLPYCDDGSGEDVSLGCPRPPPAQTVHLGASSFPSTSFARQTDVRLALSRSPYSLPALSTAPGGSASLASESSSILFSSPPLRLLPIRPSFDLCLLRLSSYILMRFSHSVMAFTKVYQASNALQLVIQVLFGIFLLVKAARSRGRPRLFVYLSYVTAPLLSPFPCSPPTSLPHSLLPLLTGILLGIAIAIVAIAQLGFTETPTGRLVVFLQIVSCPFVEKSNSSR
jgi:hypothetical protein